MWASAIAPGTRSQTLSDTNETRDRPPSVEHREDRRDEGVIHTLTISNPKRLNVLTGDLMDTLREAIKARGNERGSRVLLLRGAGPAAWIGGIDSDELAAQDENSAVELARKLLDVCLEIRRVPVPVIAVIRGYCLGPGVEIAAACDMRLAATDASFGMSEVYAGMPAVAGAAILPHIIGAGRTRELLFTGHTIDTRTAFRWGLVQGMCPPGPALDNIVQAHVSDILLGKPRAIALQKRLCKLWEERPLRESMELGLKAFGKAFEGDEPAEYFRGRPDRRSP